MESTKILSSTTAFNIEDDDNNNIKNFDQQINILE